MFGKVWRQEYVILYDDSSLIWFRDNDKTTSPSGGHQDSSPPEGAVVLRECPEMIAAGQVRDVKAARINITHLASLVIVKRPGMYNSI